MKELETYKQFEKVLAQSSAKIIKEHFRTDLRIDHKADETPVTIADKKAEERMRELIMSGFPEHGIIGEEFGNYNEDAEYTWVLDPIDGTKSFICGAITFGTLIALLKNGEPVVGVFNQPVLDEFLIGDNYTAQLNGRVVLTRECSSISDAVMLTTDHLNIEQYQNLPAFENLMRNVKLYRQWGDCYGYYLIATGFADIMIDPIMSPWDKLSLIPIIKGAGGVITDYQGNDPVAGDSIVATCGNIHEDVINILNPS